MKPVAVVISDLHFNVANLDLAKSALKQAIGHADMSKVPLIIAGDTNDSKAIIRGEVAYALISLFEYAKDLKVKVKVIPGNHDMLHEKGDSHSLEFLRPYVQVIDRPWFDAKTRLWFIPYQNDTDKLLRILHEEVFSEPEDTTVIMHQGLLGARMGAYVADKTALAPECFDGLRVISGHYHGMQEIKCGKTGLWSYIGSPYTITFSEAADGPKGFCVLMDDGSLNRVVTGLRKHVIVERPVEDVLAPIPDLDSTDLLWLKVAGPYSELEKLNKRTIGQALLGHANFRLDKVPTDDSQAKLKVDRMTGDQMLDRLIQDSEETAAQKKALKALWREIMAD